MTFHHGAFRKRAVTIAPRCVRVFTRKIYPTCPAWIIHRAQRGIIDKSASFHAPFVFANARFCTSVAAMRNTIIMVALVGTWGFTGCKKQTDPNSMGTPAPTPAAEPVVAEAVHDEAHPTQHVDGVGGAAGAHANAAHTGAANTGSANTGGANAAVAVADDNGDLTPDEAATYHKACHLVLKKMASCAKDPGFMKYQSRWTPKGAPVAGAQSFEKRSLSWSKETERSTSCKAWVKRPNTRKHFASGAKMAIMREDAKLSCEMFGQELDDDGWFPAALTTGP